MAKFFSLLFVLLLASTCWASPYLPSSDDEVLERLPQNANASNQALRQLQQDLNQAPNNLALAVRTASQLSEQARTDADPRYYGYAEAAIAPWSKNPNPPASVLLIRATIRQHRHDFTAAMADLNKVIIEQPGNGQAWLSKAVIAGVQGDYSQAASSCMMLKRLASPLIATTCSAHIASVSGKAKVAYALLNESLSRAKDLSEQLWALTVLAETAARLGDQQAAEHHFLAALALKQRDVYLLSAYTDFLLDQNRPAEVVALLKDDTRPDGLLMRLALAEQKLGAPTFTAHLQELEARMGAYRLRGDNIHQREEARLQLHLYKQPQAALDLALQNWAVQREPWDARLVLEAALAAGDLKAAKAVAEWLARVKTEDVVLQGLLKDFI